MAKAVKKMNWGQARVEVTALMPEIDLFRADNHSRMTIYEMFKEQKKVTCGFSTFCRWIDRLSDEHPTKVKNSPLPVSEPKPEPKIIPKQTKKQPSADNPSAARSGLLVARPQMAGLAENFTEKKSPEDETPQKD